MSTSDESSERPEQSTPDVGAPRDGAETHRDPTSRPHVRKTRTGVAWVGICLVAAIAVALIIFIAQNTQKVHVSFLWMDTTTPLAVALLVAAIASALLTAIVGTVRILQLRKDVHDRPLRR